MEIDFSKLSTLVPSCEVYATKMFYYPDLTIDQSTNTPTTYTQTQHTRINRPHIQGQSIIFYTERVEVIKNFLLTKLHEYLGNFD